MKREELIRHLQLEELFLLHHDHREDPDKLESMLAPDFYEVANNGQIVEREVVFDWLLNKDASTRWDISELSGRVLSPTLVLLVYKARQVNPINPESHGSWRSSLWQKPRGEEQWRMVFHQATSVTV